MPRYGFETGNPSKYEDSKCSKCGDEKLVKDMALYLVNHPIKELMELVMKSIEISGRHN